VSTFGQNPGSFNSFAFSGLNNLNQVGTSLQTMPATGTIYSVSAFFGGDGSAVNAQMVIWSSAGSILAQSATFSAPSGSRSSGGQSLLTQNLATPLYLASGTQVFIGFWRAPSGGAVWSFNTGSGTWNEDTNTSGSPGAFTGLSSNTGQLQAFATYVPEAVNAKVGGSMTPKRLFTTVSGVQTAKPVYARVGGAWKQVQ